ncbi:hypothetical protein BV898_00488 [Hypsibius exemplaris]|uniref:Uncharacterized protein n=1 Tax=Hypsibius exemplaris TaxID=2072580 RepID=A0A1W0XDM7_HYPEX|nr:hypothetical protein BV898_00488 [Hypsibius exemplaris]
MRTFLKGDVDEWAMTALPERRGGQCPVMAGPEIQLQYISSQKWVRLINIQCSHSGQGSAHGITVSVNENMQPMQSSGILLSLLTFIHSSVRSFIQTPSSPWPLAVTN